MLGLPAIPDDPKRAALPRLLHMPEVEVVDRLLKTIRITSEMRTRIDAAARRLVEGVRKRRASGGLDAFLQEFDLSSREGVVLMCLAEALLRIPDAATADRLIRDKLEEGDWTSHLGKSSSLFVNASTWALMLTGRVMRFDEGGEEGLGNIFKRMVTASGEPVIRHAVTAAMRILGRQFVMGRTIDEALARAAPTEPKGWRYSYDMLGEAARTAKDADRYFDSYAAAIAAIGKANAGCGPVAGPGISVKLSAIHPRYEVAQTERVRRELIPRVIELAQMAKAQQIGFTVDAEEAERLDLSFDIIDTALAEPSLAGWDGFGLAVQAYQKRTLGVIDWLADRAKARNRRLMVRLVKGAYWDSEIKRAQERGLDGYPVFTRKVTTDLSYLTCAQAIFAAGSVFYPQFATHNAHSVASITEYAGNRDFEFQRLHGMGEALYEQIVTPQRPCRVYAPVGSHEDLLAYLVRRLLENGANTSFVNRIADERLPISAIVGDPVEMVAKLEPKPHPRIPLPLDLYRPDRRNAAGIDLNDLPSLQALNKAMDAAAAGAHDAGPIIGGAAGGSGPRRHVTDPSDRRRVVGAVQEASKADVDAALTAATRAAADWDALPAEKRAAILEAAADLYEQDRAGLMALIVREAGRTIPDALGEVREAVDFLRYYAARARESFSTSVELPGPTGGRNSLGLHGRGVFACISPWNFPLAIFTGQIVAALAAGNAVIAKPAEQTPLIAARAVRLLHRAGVPAEVLHLLPGDGPTVGAPLVADPRIAGIAFTGSTETARAINQSLAARQGPIVPLIAETGGINAMIVDSSALPEQVVADTLTSSFNSAGQRCSALRVMFVQEDIAPKLLEMLAGAMAELSIGDPGLLSTDVGPVIDEEARKGLLDHAARMDREAKLIHACKLPESCAHGTFVAPRAYEIESLDTLQREVFGPILHVVRFAADKLDAVIDAVNATGYGLTLGIHSRIDDTIDYIRQRVRVGNLYVNRNMIGAVVGVQPFGGEGLSGTGPKAGGPHYLHRFAVERTVAVDVTAQGGNASLLMLGEG
jgi:RHH-type proline utilization regulon transcriptional repressor/proline dehydrogenase/delta 1-pyrroline-5-carboxylate dehydrogenase